MARKPDVSQYKNFDQIADRLDEIVGQVRNKDTSRLQGGRHGRYHRFHTL